MSVDLVFGETLQQVSRVGPFHSLIQFIHSNIFWAPPMWVPLRRGAEIGVNKESDKRCLQLEEEINVSQLTALPRSLFHCHLHRSHYYSPPRPPSTPCASHDVVIYYGQCPSQPCKGKAQFDRVSRNLTQDSLHK